jgi:hypothetical protein
MISAIAKLGSSDLEVSEISLGSWLTFSGGVEFEQTRACTDAAFEAGIEAGEDQAGAGRPAVPRQAARARPSP